MAESILIYSLTFFSSILLAWVYQKRLSKLHKLVKVRVFGYIIIILPTVFLASVRNGIGTDFGYYLNNYHVFQNTNIFIAIKETGEPFFTLLNYIANFLFFGQDWGIFFLSSFITMVFIVLTLDYFKKHISIPVAMFIFYMIFYLTTYNVVRQMIAVSIILFSYKYVVEKKPFKFLILVIIAALFHQSAIICLAFYFLRYIRFEHFYVKIVYLTIIFTSTLWIDSFIGLLKNIPIISGYLDKYGFEISHFGFGYLLYAIPIVAPAILFANKVIKLNPNYRFFINLSILYVPMSLLGYYQIWAIRATYYVTISQIILIPLILYSLKLKSNKILGYTMVIIYYLLIFYFEFVLNNSSESFPFMSIFQLH
ncbi:MAG: EpsG family protein [Clostridia bacterium]